MCSIAPALGFGAATTFLDRRRGVAAAAPAACGVMARKPVLHVGAAMSSSAPTKKRSRNGFDGEIGQSEGLAAGKVSAIPALVQGQQRLEERMSPELDAIRVLHRKAVLLCRGTGRSGAAVPAAKCGDAKFSAAGLRRKAPLETEAKRKKTCPSKCTPEAKHSTEAVKQQQQHRRPIQRATSPPPTKRSVDKAVDKAREIEKTRLLEEIAVAREKCRQEVLEMERTRLPDETVYPRDFEELGIAFPYAVTRTWKQAHGPAVSFLR